MNTLQKACLVITIIGALNWGFIGLLDINIIEAVFGAGSVIARVIYSIVGLTGLINVGILFTHLDED
ncbi:MAG: DUF378 domain-containing protein [Bacilli bacterium]|nr:DUF378 domain-containing protein [Bacilli bacterium]